MLNKVNSQNCHIMWSCWCHRVYFRVRSGVLHSKRP